MSSKKYADYSEGGEQSEVLDAYNKEGLKFIQRLVARQKSRAK